MQQKTVEEQSSGTTENFILEYMNKQNGSSKEIHEKVFRAEEKLQTYDDVLTKMKGDVHQKQDFLEVLKAAKLSDVEEMTKSNEEDLATVIGAILNSTDTMGAIFDDLRKYNDTEQGLIDSGNEGLQIATNNLNKAKAWGDWKNIFGWKERAIKARTQAVKDAEALQLEYAQKAKTLFNDRLRNAGLEEQLTNFLNMTARAVSLLNNVADDVVEDTKKLEVRHKLAEELVALSSKEKTRLYDLVQKYKLALDTETKNLKNFVNGTPEYDTQRGVIDTAQQKYDETKSSFEQIEAAHNSKEKFLVILQANMTANTVVESNLRSLAIKLNSDNEERQYTYANTVLLIQTANIQQTSSAIEKVGSKEDQTNLEMSLKIAAASDEDALKRLERHPHDMKNVFDVFTAFSQMQTEHKKRLDDFMENIKKGYIPDVTATPGNGNSGDGNASAPITNGTTASVVEKLMHETAKQN